MRLRLLPWIWEHVELFGGNYMGNFCRFANASRMDRSVASSVKYSCALLRSCELGLTRSLCRFMTLSSLWNSSIFPLFVKCLESLPNLHTLAIGWSDDYITNSLKNALKRCKLPQIKALTLPASAHPLLKRCRNAEDVDCLVSDRPIPKLRGFLGSIHGLKVKRLAIPLVSYCDASSKSSATPRNHQ